MTMITGLYILLRRMSFDLHAKKDWLRYGGSCLADFPEGTIILITHIDQDEAEFSALVVGNLMYQNTRCIRPMWIEKIA